MVIMEGGDLPHGHPHASETRIPPKAFNEVAYKGDRVCIQHRSGVAVYLVSEEDHRLLEALEDRLDVEDAREALARHQASGGRTVSLDEVETRLGA